MQEDVFTRVKPLKVRGEGISLAVTIRAFDGDYDLAADFLVSQGLIAENDRAPLFFAAELASEVRMISEGFPRKV
ncbi:hypothetical protein [Cryobacterium serini]|uniref:Uncharacterized protein n=1 Tax=Cryobacterium serini TaxID=1259201 RepID=A0A4R9BI69_9MICO|nr:hypothetical protein [Cryobacterium serini]TFD85162.1 hypothetical protein E3T51_15005 [Cryobacterium serini]